MAPNFLTLKRDLAILANPPAWFRPIIWVLLRIEAALGGSMMRHGLGTKAQMLLGVGCFAGGIRFWILGFMALLWPLCNVVAALAMGQD